MDKLLQRGIVWHRKMLPAASAEKVSLRAGITAIEELEAVPGNRAFLQSGTDEAVGTAEVMDWIVRQDHLAFHGVFREPEDGWEIRWRRADGKICVFKALPTVGGRCYDVHSQLGLQFRIHTKLIRIEQP